MKIRKEKRGAPPRPAVLPKETVEIAERREVLLSGVSGIDEYSDTLVRVKTKRGTVEAEGTGLIMCWAGEQKLMLRGGLSVLRFL